MKTKKCSDCNEEKPIKQFTKNHKMSDGYLKRCKDCERIREAKNEGSSGYAKIYFTHDKFYT